MGATFSKKKRDHQLRRNFVVTLVVAHRRLKNAPRYKDEAKDAMFKKMSWRKFGSQVVVPVVPVVRVCVLCPHPHTLLCCLAPCGCVSAGRCPTRASGGETGVWAASSLTCGMSAGNDSRS